MKRIMALLLVLAMCFSLLTGCGCSRQEEVEDPTIPEATEEVVAYDENLDKALEYLKVHYKNADEKTAFDYDVLGNIRIGDTVYEVVWTVDVGEDIITIVVNEDGTVTIDINDDYQYNSLVETPYVLTATITGLDGRVASTSWDRIIPPGIDEEMIAIVDAAYALKEGEALNGTQTLTGTIISVDTMYSEQYQNVTVTIVVRGREDYPIQCYRLKGAGVDKLAVGDIITVTGTLKNYYGTIEFDAGCILEDVKPGGGTPPTKPDDPAQILKDAFALKPGRSLPYNPVELTGTVTEINYDYKPGNDNMSVTINCMGYSIYCYYLYGTTSQLSNLNINDIITVEGNIKNYKGKVEFDHARITGMTNKPKPAQPSDPKQVVDDAYRLAEGSSLRYNPVTLTGKIIDFKYRYTDQYKNICPYIVIEGRENKPIYCFGLTGKGIKEVDIGDTITVRGNIKNYYGDIEFEKPTLVSYEKQKLEECPEDPAEILKDAYALEKGEMTPYVATLTGAISSIDSPYNSQYDNISVWITVEGHNDMPVLAYRTKGKDAKLLGIGDIIEVTGRIINYNGKIEFVEGSPFKLIKKVASVEANAEQKALEKKLAAVGEHDDGYVDNEVITVVGTIISAPRQSSRNEIQWWFDLYDGWNTITCYYVPMTGYETAPMKGDKISVTGKLVARSGTGQFTEDTATAKWLESGGLVAPELPDADSTLTIPEAQETAMAAGSGNSSGKYYVKGKVKEISNTEYGNMTIVDADGNELYIYGTYSKDGATRYDDLPVKPVVGKTYTFYGKLGTFNNSPQMVNGWIQELGNKELDFSKIPAADSALTIPKAIEVAEFAGGVYTTPNKYYVTGTIKEVSADQYGNMTIKDAQGNELYIYGTWTEDGNTRYGKVSGEKPGVGDEITVYGILGVHNKTIIQMQNGWIVGLKNTTSGGGSGDSDVKDPVVTVPNPAESAATKVADGTYVIWYAGAESNLAATALSTDKTYGYLYNPVSVTLTGNVLSGYTNANIFTITNNSDGTFTMKDCYGRTMYMDGTHNTFAVAEGAQDADDWKLYQAADGAYYIKNVAKGKFAAYDPQYKSYGSYSDRSAGYILHLTAVAAGSGTEQEKVEEPANGSTLTIPEANALGLKFANDTYSEGKFYVTGKVTEIVKDDYGNLYIADEQGNKLFIYGSYSEDGNTRYDDLKDPPQVGDTITVFGKIGKYNDSAQMKNVNIQGATAAGGGDEGGDSGDTGDDTDVAAATIDLSNMDNRTSYSTTQQVWEQNGITVTNDKAASINDVGNYAPARFYQSSSLTISYPGMMKIVIDCDGSGIQEKHITAWKTSYPDAVISGTTVTITLAAAQDTFTIESFAAQARAASISVYTDAGDEGGDDPAPTVSTGTLSFASTANRVSQDDTSQIWSANGIAFTNTKTSASDNVKDYFNPVRCYKNSTITIDCDGMTQIVFNCNTADYATSLAASIGGVTADGKTVTVVLDPAQDSYDVALSDGQVRLDSITVTGTGVTSTGGDSGDSGDSGDTGDTNLPAMPTEDQKATLADGTYVIYNAATSKAATALTEDKTYGYMPGTAITVGGEYDATVIFTITNNADGTFTLTDSFGRILYMTGSFTSVNLATAATEGDDWQLYKAADGTYYIKNVLKEKYMAYDASYGSYGVYEDMREGTLLTIIPVNAESGDDSGDDETKPVIAGPFYLGVYKANDEIALYFNGAMDTSKNYYLGTTTDATKAVKVYTETLDGAVKIYFMNGNTKTYIETYVSGTHVNNQLVTEPTMSYTWDASIGTYTVILNIDGTDTAYYLGTYADNTGSEIKPSKTSFITAENLGVEQFVIKLVENAEDLIPEGAGDETPDKPEAEIVDEAFALQTGAALSQKVTLTGKVTAIDYAFSPNNKNISVVMEVFGTDGKAKSLDCFRLTGEDIVLIKVGDIITVNGIISRYDESTVQFNAGSTLVKLTESDGTEKTLDSVVKITDPQEIIDEAFNLSNYEVIPYEVSLTGKVTNVGTYDTSYKNVTVKIEVEGKTIECYRLSGDGADQIAVGDTITVTGYLCNYGGTVEFLQGCTFTKVVTLNVENDKVESAPPVEEPPVEETPVEEVPIEEAPVEETPTVEAPAEESPVEEAPVDEVPVVDPVAEVPAEENAA